MTRLDKLDPDALDTKQRALYDSIAGGARAEGTQAFALVDENGRLEGPFNAMLLSPHLGAALQALGSAVRYRGQLTDRAREIAILVVAHHWQSDFELYAHEAVGRTAGLTAEELAALRDGRWGALPDQQERLIARTVSALVVRSDLDEEEFAAAVALGAAVLFELLTLVGYYAALALQLRVFRVPVPGG